MSNKIIFLGGLTALCICPWSIETLRVCFPFSQPCILGLKTQPTYMAKLKDTAGLMFPILQFSQPAVLCLLAMPSSSLSCFIGSPFPLLLLTRDAPSFWALSWLILWHLFSLVVASLNSVGTASGHLARSQSHLWFKSCQYKFGNKYVFHFSGLKMANIQVWKSNIMRLTMPVKRKDRLVNCDFSEPDPKPNL